MPNISLSLFRAKVLVRLDSYRDSYPRGNIEKKQYVTDASALLP
jgi:hypothetical protein